MREEERGRSRGKDEWGLEMNSWFGLLQKSTLTAGFGSLPRRMHEHTARDTYTESRYIHTYIYISKLSQLVGHYGKAVVVVVVVAVSACHECPVADNNNNNNNSNT